MKDPLAQNAPHFHPHAPPTTFQPQLLPLTQQSFLPKVQDAHFSSLSTTPSLLFSSIHTSTGFSRQQLRVIRPGGSWQPAQVNITMLPKNLFPVLCASIVCLLASPSSSGKRFGVSAQNATVTIPARPLDFRVPGDADFGSPGGSTCENSYCS